MRRAALAAVLLFCGLFPLTAHATGGAGSFDWYSYTNASGTRTYKVFVPPSYDGRPMPLLVDLHGCNPDSAPTEARWSRFNQLATQRGFLVAYPQQDPAANGAGCWNWFQPADQSREPGTTVPVPNTTDAGEPSMIAGITTTVMSRWHIDPRRVYVGGISAGGAMADVMTATYPDLYAAALVYAGCEYLGTTCTEGPAALPPSVSGQLAYQAMGRHARVVPVIVVHGTADEVVPYSNAKLVVEQFLHADAWAVDGSDTAPAVSLPDHTTTATAAGGQTYMVDEYHDAAGCLQAAQWSVVGMLHAWSDGASDGSTTDTVFTDPAGPDVTTPIIDFLLSHPMPVSGRACHQEPLNSAGPGPVPARAVAPPAQGPSLPGSPVCAASVAASDQPTSGRTQPPAPPSYFAGDFPRFPDELWGHSVGGAGGLRRGVPLHHTPVIFVHGNQADAQNWLDVMLQFQNDAGYTMQEMYALSYSGLGDPYGGLQLEHPLTQLDLDYIQQNPSILTTAGHGYANDDEVPDLCRFIEAVQWYTGSRQVDIVAHSLGVTLTRRLMQLYPSLAADITAFVGIAGGNHGTTVCRGLETSYYGCNEIAPGTAWLDRLNGPGGSRETYAPTKWMTIYNGLEGDPFFIGPDEQSPRLLGADNKTFPGQYHNDLRVGSAEVDTYLPFLLRSGQAGPGAAVGGAADAARIAGAQPDGTSGPMLCGIPRLTGDLPACPPIPVAAGPGGASPGPAGAAPGGRLPNTAPGPSVITATLMAASTLGVLSRRSRRRGRRRDPAPDL